MNSGIEPAIGTPSSLRTTKIERKGDGDRDDEAVGPDLRHGDLEGRHRHDQQMVHRAMLALAHERGAGEDDGQHGHIVDDPHDAGEPGRVTLGLKAMRTARLTGGERRPSDRATIGVRPPSR